MPIGIISINIRRLKDKTTLSQIFTFFGGGVNHSSEPDTPGIFMCIFENNYN